MPSIVPDLTSRYLCEEAGDTDQFADSVGSKPSTSLGGSPDAFVTFRRFNGAGDAFFFTDAGKPLDSGSDYSLYFLFTVTNIYTSTFKRLWRSVTAGTQGPFLDWDGANSRFRFASHAAAGSSNADADIGSTSMPLGATMFVGISYDFASKVPRIVVKSTSGIDSSGTGPVASVASISNNLGHQVLELSGSNHTELDLEELGIDNSAFASIGDLQDTANSLLKLSNANLGKLIPVSLIPKLITRIVPSLIPG